jgi:hypothetical protein
MRYCYILVAILVLAACGSPQASTPAPTPQAIYLEYPSSLQPWADRLSDCAADHPQVALYFLPSSQPTSDINSNQIILELNPSEQAIKSASLYQVGIEQIVVIVNQANPLLELSNDELRSIFSGQQSTWPEDSGEPVQVWVLPQGDQVRSIFNSVVMQTMPLTTDAMLAPDPTAMLEAVSENVNAIGYLPASFLNSSGSVDPGKVSIVQLDNSFEASLSQPVVAITAGEPEGLLRSLLVCLDSSAP